MRARLDRVFDLLPEDVTDNLFRLLDAELPLPAPAPSAIPVAPTPVETLPAASRIGVVAPGAEAPESGPLERDEPGSEEEHAEEEDGLILPDPVGHNADPAGVPEADPEKEAGSGGGEALRDPAPAHGVQDILEEEDAHEFGDRGDSPEPYDAIDSSDDGGVTLWREPDESEEIPEP